MLHHVLLLPYAALLFAVLTDAASNRVKLLSWLRGSGDGYREALALCVVTALAVWLRASIDLHHVMYVDEPWHVEAARRWLEQGAPVLCDLTLDGPRCVPYPKSLGMPALLLGFFAVFGASSKVACSVSFVVGVSAVPLAFWVATRAGASRLGALVPASLIAFAPLHAAWCATAESNVAGASFALVAMGYAIGYLRAPSVPTMVRAVLAVLIALSLRAEAAPLCPALFAIACLTRTDTRTKTLGIGLVAGAMLLACTFVWPMVTLNREIQGGAFLELAHVLPNLARGARPSDDLAYAAPFLALVVLGAAFAIREGRLREVTLVAVTSVASTFGVLMYADFQPRMLIVPAALFAPLAGFVVAPLGERVVSPNAASIVLSRIRVGGIVVFVLVGLLLARTTAPMEAVRHVPDSQWLEMRLPELARSTPRGASTIFVTEWPTIIAATVPADVIRTDALLEDEGRGLLDLLDTRELFFVCDMFCEPGYAGGQAACPRLLERVHLEPVAMIRRNDRAYGVHRVVGLREPGSPEGAGAQCPFVHRSGGGFEAPSP